MVEEISLSIEETNKIRISLGLKPIPVEKSKVEVGSKRTDGVQSLSVAETNKIRLSLGLAPIILDDSIENNERNELDNHEKYNDTILQEDKSEKLKRRIQEAKEKSQKRRKLVNEKTLSDEGNTSEITDNWLSKLGKPKENNIKKTQKTKKILNKDNTIDIKVAHTQIELSGLKDNEILTLEDTNILNDDDDALTNEKLMRDNKLKKEIREKLIADSIRETGRSYSSVADDNSVDLSSDTDYVKLSNSTIKLDLEKIDNVSKEEFSNRIRVEDLFSEINEETGHKSDYAKQKKTTKIKKNKMKIASKVRTNFEPEVSLELKEVKLDSDDNDQFDKEDQELQSILSFKRKLKQKSERRKLTPEQIANEVKNAQKWEVENEMENVANAAQSNINSRIVYDSTSDFLENLTNNTDVLQSTSTTNDNGSPELNGLTKEKSVPKPYIQESGVAGITLNAEDEKDKTPSFNKGLASTLNFLRMRDDLHINPHHKSQSERIQREAVKQNELFKIKVSIEERLLREELHNDKSFRNLPKIERDAKFEMLLDARLQEKNIVLPNISSRVKETTVNSLESYKPDVKLSYRDDDGNELNTKQAFKYLSHQFHGVGPSKKSFQKKNSLPSKDSSSIL